jgi:disease resistance protein RPM1
MSLESREKWETVRRSMGLQMESHPTLEGMSQILTISYNHLPHELKSCMMYLSIFPEDYVISKDRLLHRWIAEGLVSEKRGLTMLEVAESYFNKLLSRSMIFSVQRRRYMHEHFDYDGKLECCQVHDMVLEVMVSKSLEYNFLSLLGGQYNGMSYDRIRRLSIHEGMDSRTSLHISKEGMNGLQHVRSLSMFQLHGNKHLLDQLGNFTLLRVLDLEGCEGIENKHVRYACQLHLLKFLSFKDTTIREVPLSNQQSREPADT